MNILALLLLLSSCGSLFCTEEGSSPSWWDSLGTVAQRFLAAASSDYEDSEGTTRQATNILPPAYATTEIEPTRRMSPPPEYRRHTPTRCEHLPENLILSPQPYIQIQPGTLPVERQQVPTQQSSSWCSPDSTCCKMPAKTVVMSDERELPSRGCPYSSKFSYEYNLIAMKIFCCLNLTEVLKEKYPEDTEIKKFVCCMRTCCCPCSTACLTGTIAFNAGLSTGLCVLETSYLLPAIMVNKIRGSEL